MSTLDDVITSTRLAQNADEAWQAALDMAGINRWTLQARTYIGLRELYQDKVRADQVMSDTVVAYRQTV